MQMRSDLISGPLCGRSTTRWPRPIGRHGVVVHLRRARTDRQTERDVRARSHADDAGGRNRHASGVDGPRWRGAAGRRGAGAARRADPDVGPRLAAPSRAPTSSGSTRSSASSPRDCARTRKAPIRSSACCERSACRTVVRVGLPHGAMHLDGLLAIIDRDLAVVWPRRTPFKVVDTLRRRGFRFIEVEDEGEAQHRLPMNFVALAPGEILMPAGGRAHAAAVRSCRSPLPHASTSASASKPAAASTA